jgi:hypothetical protein
MARLSDLYRLDWILDHPCETPFESSERKFASFEYCQGSVMNTEAIETTTLLPDHPEELAPVVGFLAAHKRRHDAAARPSYALVGTDEHARIELPEAVHQASTKVVAALHAGKAVTIAGR